MTDRLTRASYSVEWEWLGGGEIPPLLVQLEKVARSGEEIDVSFMDQQATRCRVRSLYVNRNHSTGLMTARAELEGVIHG